MIKRRKFNMQEKLRSYYNHLKEESSIFNHLGKEWVYNDSDPEFVDFQDNSIFALYFKGYAGISYMQDDHVRYKGYFVETPTGIGITEFSSLESSEDCIRDKLTVPPIYKNIELMCIHKSTDPLAGNDADFLICEQKEKSLFDLYIATKEGLKPLILGANNIEPAEYETEWLFSPDFDNIIIPSRTTSNLELVHAYTILKSIKVEKNVSFTAGEYNSVQSDLFKGETHMWEADFQLAFWEEPESDKYSIKWAVESKVYERYYSCLKDNVCRLGKLKDTDPYICSECMEKDTVNVQALISIEKLLNGEYLEEHKEYSDFFTEEVLNLKKPE